MRFLSMIRIDENGGQTPSEQLMNDMGQLIEQMTREGRSSAPPGFGQRRKVSAYVCGAASCPQSMDRSRRQRKWSAALRSSKPDRCTTQSSSPGGS